MGRMRFFLFAIAVTASHFLFCFSSYAQQYNDDAYKGDVIVGLSLRKHTGPITNMALSADKDRVATISEDHTIKVWDYPSLRFLSSINLPEKQGLRGRFNVCAFFPFDSRILLVAENSGTDYERRKTTRYDELTSQLHKKTNGSLLDYLPSSVESSFFFYIVNWKDNVILDRAGNFPYPVSQFVFSPDNSLLLVLTKGETAALFDTNSMLLINELTFDDETIITGVFTPKNEAVIITSHSIYKIRFHQYSNVLYSTRELLYKRSIKKGLFRPKTIDHAFFDEDNTLVYLFSENSYIGTVSTLSGKWIKKNKPHFDLPIVDSAVKDITTVKNISFDGKETISSHKSNRFERKQYQEIEVRRAYRRLYDSLTFIAPDSSFIYRQKPSPHVICNNEGLNIWYDNERVFRLDEKGLQPSLNYAIKNEDKVNQVDFTYRVGNLYDLMIEMSPHIVINHQAIYFLDSGVPTVIKEGSFKQPLPARPNNIYYWINNNHFLISLQDGTLRFYNSVSGQEELALFISKEGDWVIWAPTGEYKTNNSIMANWIEWRQTDYASVITKKPKDVRRRYYNPDLIDSVLSQLFNSKINEISFVPLGTIEGLVSIDTAYVINNKGIRIDYKLHDYNPVLLGSYSLLLDVDGEKFKQDKFQHFPYLSGGSIVFSTENKVDQIRLYLRSINDDVLSSDSFSMNVKVKNVHLTTVGIDDYSNNSRAIDLPSSLNDVATICDLFQDPHLFSKRNTHVFTDIIQNEQVTSNRMRSKLEELKKNVMYDDLVIFYFSGHGERKDNVFNYLTCFEDDVIDLNSFISSCSEIPGYKLFVVDACFSGSLSDIRFPNTAILTSSRADEYSIAQDDISESLFTEALMNSIHDVLSEGSVFYLQDLFNSIQRRIPEEKKQHPTYNNTLTNLLIVSR